ncbi:MAG: radical SAM protein [Clostridia bacterium]
MDSLCRACPRECNALRPKEIGFCGVADSKIARAALHFYEEPPISGTRGSGAIFFVGCNMRCVFCQNSEISANAFNGKTVNSKQLSKIMLKLQDLGAHNINLVTPAPHLKLIAEAIVNAKSAGLSIPIVYNTNAYETVAAIKSLNGLVDIFLPDLKYIDPALSEMFSKTRDYFKFAAPAIDAMFNMVGDLTSDENNIAKSGVLIRHLVLPGCLSESRRILDYIKESYGASVHYSLMCQYFPAYRANNYPAINRKLTQGERKRIIEYAIFKDLTNGYIQDLESASEFYVPSWDLTDDN